MIGQKDYFSPQAGVQVGVAGRILAFGTHAQVHGVGQATWGHATLKEERRPPERKFSECGSVLRL